ncbi:MAG TPA: ATP-binding protein [Archangium sp.]|nr:ATP-binding protein [Archangium sp.]
MLGHHFRSNRSRIRKTGGVGLGLALSRRIIIAHGGTLTLESQPDQGTTVRVTLPAAPEAGQPLARRARGHRGMVPWALPCRRHECLDSNLSDCPS